MKYTVLPEPHQPSDMHPVQIDEGEFAGCQVVFGQISFGETPDGNVPLLKFDYEVVNDYNVKDDQVPALEQCVGDLIVQLLEESLERNETIYKGGA
jgi:hypothetical protein